MNSSKISIKKLKNNGNGNINGSNINGNSNIIGNRNVIINPQVNTNEIQYDYETKGKPIKRKAVKKTNRVSLVLTILGLTSDLIGVGTFLYSVFNNKIEIITSVISNVFFISMLVTLISIGIYLFTKDMLNGKQLAWVKLFGLYDLAYKSVNQDHIYRVIIKGSCPKCGGDVTVREYKYGPEKQIRRKEGVCSDNPEAHRFTFDHTTFKGELIKE